MDITIPIDKGLIFFREQFIAQDIQLKLSINNDLPKVAVHPQQFEQIVVNLLSNARYAVNKKAEDNPEDYEKLIEIIAESDAKNNNIIFKIIDNGIGMSPDEKERCLEPFFTKRQVGQGSGLGLSIVNSIVKDFDGELIVVSKEGDGTTMKISIPVPGAK